jgi:hypothetical protein
MNPISTKKKKNESNLHKFGELGYELANFETKKSR